MRSRCSDKINDLIKNDHDMVHKPVDKNHEKQLKEYYWSLQGLYYPSC